MVGRAACSLQGLEGCLDSIAALATGRALLHNRAGGSETVFERAFGGLPGLGWLVVFICVRVCVCRVAR